MQVPRSKSDLSATNVAERRKILYVNTEDWHFCSHRLPMARAMREAGFDVIVATRVREHGPTILKEGFKLVELEIVRKGKSLWQELHSIIELARLYRRERPHLIHHVALKPVLYGSIAALFFPQAGVVNAITGFGFLFTSDRARTRLARHLLLLLFYFILRQRNCQVILQNRDDFEVLCNASIPPSKLTIVRGSGVNLKDFPASPLPQGRVTVVFAARMLWNKGVGEYVAAAEILRRQGAEADFLLVGDTDLDNPNAVPRTQLEVWAKQGAVRWMGKIDDMNSILAQSHIVCLPSYREGLPKVLLEAASCGRPIIATDVPGCREIVENNLNGILVPVKNVDQLASALNRLIGDASLRQRMGTSSRDFVSQFSEDQVVRQTMSVYFDVLDRKV